MGLSGPEAIQLARVEVKVDGIQQSNTLTDERIKNLGLQIEHLAATQEARARQFETSLGAQSSEFAKHVGESEVKFARIQGNIREVEIKARADIDSARLVAANQNKVLGQEVVALKEARKNESGWVRYVVNALIAIGSAILVVWASVAMGH